MATTLLFHLKLIGQKMFASVIVFYGSVSGNMSKIQPGKWKFVSQI